MFSEVSRQLLLSSAKNTGAIPVRLRCNFLPIGAPNARLTSLSRWGFRALDSSSRGCEIRPNSSLVGTEDQRLQPDHHLIEE